MTRAKARASSLARIAVAVTAIGAAAAGGCSDAAPTPRLFAVSPPAGHTDRPRQLRLLGSEFRPPYRFDLGSGTRQSEAAGFTGSVGAGAAARSLRALTVLGPGLIEATLDPGLPPGDHDVTLVDPRGARTTLARAFTALGPDVEAPKLDLAAPLPTTPLAPGAPVQGRAIAADVGAVAALTWHAEGPAGRFAGGTCAVPPIATPAPVLCDFAFAVPVGFVAGDPVRLQVNASDDAPVANRTTVTRSFVLLARPALLELTPTRGGSLGGTDVVVRGSGLLPGTRVTFDDVPLEPAGGTWLDDGTVVGRAPPHAPGNAVVRVLTPLGATAVELAFVYLAAPQVASVEPARGAPQGGETVRVRGANFTASTQILLGAQLATAQPLLHAEVVAADEIRGVVPPGEGPTTIFAVDPTAGLGSLPDAFTWERAP